MRPVNFTQILLNVHCNNLCDLNTTETAYEYEGQVTGEWRGEIIVPILCQCTCHQTRYVIAKVVVVVGVLMFFIKDYKGTLKK